MLRLYYWMDPHPDEYEKVPETDENILGLELKPAASKEAVQALYRFLVQVEDKTDTIQYDAARLSKRMIEMFKASKCYQSKTEKERKEIIQYLNDHPAPDPPAFRYIK